MSSPEYFAYFEPRPGGMAIMRARQPKGWLEVPHEKIEPTGLLTCAECRCDLRPNATPRHSAFNIPDAEGVWEVRLFCEVCCNSGDDELRRLSEGDPK